MIFGNMILLPTPGPRKPTLAEQQDTAQRDFRSVAKAILVLAMMEAIERISGNMIRQLTLGHRKPTLGEK
jgi:hypothetical protein